LNRNRDGDDILSPNGVYIQGVVSGSAADTADEDGQIRIQAGDAIAKIDGYPLKSTDDLFAILGSKLAGSTVKLQLSRRGVMRETRVKLAKLYAPGKIIASHKPEAIGGLRVDYTSVLYLRNPQPLGTGRISPGVAVSEVLPGSPAQAAKLQVDQIITRVNGQEVNSPAEFYEAAAKAKGALSLQIVKSEGATDEITLKIR
jgi:serine protease Do